MDNNESFQFFLNFYADLPRQGPGDDRITRHILGLLVDLPPDPVIIDMGCGSGAQSIVLAQEGCRVTAVDIHKIILDKLEKRLNNDKLKDKITCVCSGMESFKPETPVDLIWSEGAIYSIGFKQGLTLWHPYLKKDGYIVVSEISWLIDKPPHEALEFWNKEYPAMQSVSENQAIIKETGYQWIGSILLPNHAWDTFYEPQKEKILRLRSSATLTKNEDAELKLIEDEIRIFKEYQGTYGYVFYLMQRII
ncbi:MAG: class I SAM-dependent methyltransferase [Methanomicrobiales archaeon]|mgnify:CR=1 FL=1|nr:class I SAM-dependent methyltransferase [Methanomicrobiales archaeon]